MAGNGQVERLAKSAGTPNNTREPAQTDKKKPQLITVGASVLVEAGEVKPRSASEGVSPCRIDVVSCALETRRRLWFAQMPIKPNGLEEDTHLRYTGLPALHRGQEAVYVPAAGQGRRRDRSGHVALGSWKGVRRRAVAHACSLLVFQGEALGMLDGLNVQVDIEIRPIEMTRRGLLDIQHGSDGGFAEPWELPVGQKQLAPSGQQPDASPEYVGHLNPGLATLVAKHRWVHGAECYNNPARPDARWGPSLEDRSRPSGLEMLGASSLPMPR